MNDVVYALPKIFILIILVCYAYSLENAKKKRDLYDLLIGMAWIFIFGFVYLSMFL